MATKTFAGNNIEVNDEGYLISMGDWNEDVAKGLAEEEGIELTEMHFKVLEFMRNKVSNGETLTIRAVGKSGIIDIKQFYSLFPGGPLKKSSKIAGIAKPSSCV